LHESAQRHVGNFRDQEKLMRQPAIRVHAGAATFQCDGDQSLEGVDIGLIVDQTLPCSANDEVVDSTIDVQAR
jgi:hypothetical protein